jgi:hypothetical protein
MVIAPVAKRIFAESVQMEQQLQVEQMQQMCRSVIRRTAELFYKKNIICHACQSNGRIMKAKACLHSTGVGGYDAVAGFSRAVSQALQLLLLQMGDDWSIDRQSNHRSDGRSSRLRFPSDPS